MPDLIFLFLLVPRIGKLALSKGLDGKSWKRKTIFIWFGAEIIGGFLAFVYFGKTNWMMINLTALGFAIAAFFTVRDFLLRKDDIKVKPFDINKHVEN